MDQLRFLKWKVYRDAKDLFKDILKIYQRLSSNLQWTIGSQLLRSCQSIVLNIAEGCGKESDKELNRFIDIAIGSSYETLANADLLMDNGLIQNNEFVKITESIEEILKQLGGFKKRLK